MRVAPVHIDSQAKYASLALGDGGGNQEKIWVRRISRVLVSYDVLTLGVGPGAGITAHRGRWCHLGLTRASSGLWTWENARREFWCRRSEEGACGGDCGCWCGVGGGDDGERR